ncbi:uncharacterized protein LOC112200807 [Rosa chinensis]|uniref:uncharacterized protein LOC112200807 n=1 Tax=Rosa chinensis TaxID=74649 RepID=UPI001AD8AF30|nr:uncharacterized protein LOC112200807 [Rosa chinensis]
MFKFSFRRYDSSLKSVKELNQSLGFELRGVRESKKEMIGGRMGSYYKEHRILPHFQNSACCISIQYNFAMRLGGLRDKDGFMLSTFNSISFLFETIQSNDSVYLVDNCPHDDSSSDALLWSGTLPSPGSHVLQRCNCSCWSMISQAWSHLFLAS